MGTSCDDVIFEADLEDTSPETETFKFTYHNGATSVTDGVTASAYATLRTAALTGGSTWTTTAASTVPNVWSACANLPQAREIACKDRVKRHCIRYDPSAA